MSACTCVFVHVQAVVVGPRMRGTGVSVCRGRGVRRGGHGRQRRLGSGAPLPGAWGQLAVREQVAGKSRAGISTFKVPQNTLERFGMRLKNISPKMP